MYSIMFSRIEMGINHIKDRLKEIVNSNMKVCVLPWSFPIELDAEKLDNEFFKKGERRYNKYIGVLKEIGIKEDNIKVLNCYSMSNKELTTYINNSDILLLTGGNLEMFFKKVVHDTEILYDIKHYKGIIIGESAGTELQLKRYFITAKNNYYKYFAFYDGFGVLDDPFYIDVHTINNKFYLDKLRKVSKEVNKDIYLIYDDGAMLYNRENNKLELFGHVDKIDYNE